MSSAPSASQELQQLARALPQSIEAEMCVLGAMVLDRSAIDIAVQILRGDYFAHRPHAHIYDVLVDMSQASAPIDLVTLRDELDRRKLIDSIGGVDYLVSLAEGVPNAANVEYYARIVRDKALLRRLISVATELRQEAFESTEETAVVLDRAEKRVFELASAQITDSAASIGDVIQATFEQMENLDGSMVTGVPTGFGQLDQLTSGFQAGEMIIIAARPSVGKTAIALNMAEHMATNEGHAVLFFSLEMTKQQLAQRFLAVRAQMDLAKMRRGSISADDWTALQLAAGELEKAPIFIDDSPELTVLQMRAKARRMKAQHDIQCVFIDYIQLITPGSGESRQVQVSDISRNIKALARELGIPVITLAQLNRSVEERIGHRPRMSDLRESGSIEQDADVVCLLHRPDYFDADAESGVAEFIVAKQRNGPTDTVKLIFRKECTRFENYHAADGGI